ncbi:lanthionine synthetase LanC family protein [Pyxidicoccus sp. 3LG]
MNVSSTLVLPPDVVIVPVERLAPEVRARASCQDGDSAITRPRSRAPSRILDRDSARLVAEFREPTTLLAAVLRYCLAERLEPMPTLEAAWPMLQGLIRARLLVPEDSEEARDIQPSLRPGDSLHGFQVVRCVQVLEDMEVFEARAPEGEPVALKMARGEAPGPRALLAHEARVLGELAGQVAPRLIDSGRAFLAMEWCPGTRVAPSSGGRDEALARGIAVLETFAALHARGVVHGDVHPGNVLLAPDGSVRLVDFGLARLLGEPADSAPPRGGVAFFQEPELARASLAGRRPPPASVAGEQYSLAAMVWWLVTGHYAFDFSLERRELLQQLAEATPVPFSARGLEPWPEVEAVLLRALSKEPSERHASVADLARALRAAMEPGGRVEARGAGTNGLLESVLEKARPGGLWLEQGFPAVPCCSVNFGAAGLAHALYRMAVQQDAPELISLADVWCVRALQRMGEPHAFLLPEQDLSEDVVDACSVLHTAGGLHVVRALVAQAMGDVPTCERAVTEFLGGLEAPWRVLDLALGRGGALLGCSLLHEALPCSSLLAAGTQVSRELMERLEQHGGIAEERAPLNLGIAHGWAGLLYVLLRWCGTSGTPVPSFVKARLEELAGLGEPSGRGLRWRWEWARQGDVWVSVSMPGWCNGSAGYVFLWSLAHRMLGGSRWLELAELAAWDAWDGGLGPANLCCGLTGRAYALLNVYRATGDSAWMERARCLGERAVTLSQGPEPHPGSLFKGDVGLALLLSDLRTPETARMPFFEDEGWPRAR